MTKKKKKPNSFLISVAFDKTFTPKEAAAWIKKHKFDLKTPAFSKTANFTVAHILPKEGWKRIRTKRFGEHILARLGFK